MTLRLTGGNKSAAARVLGISRPTLHRKIEEYGLGVVPA
jgi:DNA-binding protein Fis